jgi:predicted TIM-barrel fold metal-dependent hydrolase
LISRSNWPVSARFAPLERVVAIARELLATKSPDDAERVLRTNAEGIYRV